jgi:hypothetical protein
MAYSDPNSGGFGNSASPDLSNPWKVSRYNDYLAGKGEFAGQGGGGGGLDTSSIPSALGFAQTLSSGEDAVLANLVATMKGQATPMDIYGKLEEQAGIPALRTSAKSLSSEVYSLEDQIRQIEPDVSARTRQSLVTEAQRRGLVTEGQKPLRENLSTISTNLGRVLSGLSLAQSDVNTKTGLTMQGQQQELEPYKLQYTALVDRNARLMTGFTADRQTAYDTLIAKWQRNNQLDDREWQLAADLSKEENSYTRELQKAAASAGAKLTGGESMDQLLGLIGTQAAEEIAWSRRKSATGTAEERKITSAKEQAVADARSGATSEQLARSYGDILKPYELLKIINDNNYYGGTINDPYNQFYKFFSGQYDPNKDNTSGVSVNPDGSITIK